MKMHALKIAQCLEPQGFEGCERGIFRKLSSYYIHHFSNTKAKKKVGILYPPTKKKGWVYYTRGRFFLVGIIYPPGKQKKAGIIYPLRKADFTSRPTTR